MKKGVLIVLILVVLCVGVIVLKGYNNKDTQQHMNNISNENMVNNINTIENTLEDSNNTNKYSQDVDTNVNEEETFKIKKVEKKDFDNNYTIEEQYEIINKKYFSIEKQNDDLVISIIKSEQNENLFKLGKGVTYNKKYVINNIKAKDVENIFCGGEGQDLLYPIVFLLQKDGTIKGVNIEYGYKTGNFVAKSVSGLENVEKIEQASVTPVNDSGYEAIIAITKDKTVYEIGM